MGFEKIRKHGFLKGNSGKEKAKTIFHRRDSEPQRRHKQNLLNFGDGKEKTFLPRRLKDAEKARQNILKAEMNPHTVS
jgi:hypothetical protein